MTAPPPTLDRRFGRPWRWALLGYGLVMTAGTHWPQFTFGPEMPATDKTVHLAAFAVLTVILWWTRWFSSPLLAAAVAAGWAALDEWTQGIPWFGRHVAWSDVVSNWLGITLATAWIMAMRPVGGRGARWRHAMLLVTYARMWGTPRRWALMVAIALLAPLAYVVLRLVEVPQPAGFSMRGIGWERALLLTVGVVIGHVMVWISIGWWNRSIAAARRHGICVRCGVDDPWGEAVGAGEAAGVGDGKGAGERDGDQGRAPAAGHAGDDHDAAPANVVSRTAPCRACDAVCWSGAWLQPAPSSIGVVLRTLRLPALTVIALMVLLTLAIAFFPLLLRMASDWPAVAPVAQWAHDVLRSAPTELANVIDLTIIGLAAAGMTLAARRRGARWYDDPPHCRRCGHDLRATPATDGIGRCAECGAAFVRGGRSTSAGAAATADGLGPSVDEDDGPPPTSATDAPS